MWIADGVVIGNDVRIQAFSFIPYGVTIEDGAFIGPRVTFTNDPKMSMDKGLWRETRVCSGAKIGAGAIIVAGVTIGANALIGAGSVVTRSVPEGETWAGNPARPLHKSGNVSQYYMEV